MECLESLASWASSAALGSVGQDESGYRNRGKTRDLEQGCPERLSMSQSRGIFSLKQVKLIVIMFHVTQHVQSIIIATWSEYKDYQ